MRTAMLVVKTTSGKFLDPISGGVLSCVADSSDSKGIDDLVECYRNLRDGNGTIKVKKDEIKLDSLMLLASHTAGGELKATRKFR